MAEPATIGAQTSSTMVVEAPPVEIAEPSPTPFLDQYMVDVKRLMEIAEPAAPAEGAIVEEKEPVASTSTEATPKAPAATETQPAKDQRTEMSFDVLSDEQLDNLLRTPKVQAELDRRAARQGQAYVRRQQEQIAQRGKQEADAKARAELDAELKQLVAVTRAPYDPYDADAVERFSQASQRLGEIVGGQIDNQSVQEAQRQAWDLGVQDARQDLASQIEASYAVIPNFHEGLRYQNFATYDAYAKAVMDHITAQSTAEREAGDETRIEAAARERADLLANEKIAQLRGRMPNPDITPERGASAGSLSTVTTFAEAAAAFKDGRLGRQEFKQLRYRNMLPAGHPSYLPFDEAELRAS